ncbi:MAG: phenylpyruvate tautomerase MIF-related protein [bacterium]
MPLIKLHIPNQLNEEKKGQLLSTLSKIVAEDSGKPEKYVMALIEKASIMMSGRAGESAFVDIRGIGGLTKEVNRKISKHISELLSREIGIKPERIYITFIDIPASNWGWNGEIFG